MPSQFLLAPAPKWYFFDKDGKLAVGGKMHTYSSLDHVTPKPVFSDPAGTSPYLNPIILDGTGSTPVPIYWEQNGTDLYYVLITDANDNKIATIDDYPIVGTTGGGGSTIIVDVDVDNQLINGQFHLINNQIFGGLPSDTPTIPLSPVPTGYTRVAPGGGSIDSLRGTGGSYLGGSQINDSNESINNTLLSPLPIPGWVFIKSGGGTLVDTIDFPLATPGIGLPNGPSANAPRYFQYNSTNSIATTELDLTYIIGDVRAYAGETIQISFDAFCNTAAPATNFLVEQYFGTGGGASASVNTLTPFSFPNNTWSRISLTIAVPNINGKIIGTNQDSQLRLRWRIPGNNINTYRLASMQLTRGATVLTDYIYEPYNKISSQVLAELIHAHLAKTGDVKFSVAAQATTGWIVVVTRNSTLGNDSSSATFKGEEVRNLYRLLWTTYNDTNCPVSSGRGANADADFNANKTIQLPPWLGTPTDSQPKVIAPVDNVSASINLFTGASNRIITIDNMPAHTHSITGSLVAGLQQLAGVPYSPFINTGTTVTTSVGNNIPFNITQPTAFLYLHVKL